MTDKFDRQLPPCEPLKVSDFERFYRAIHGYTPFQWQSRLVERVCRGKWPEFLNLPTASGKTAAIDIAVFALAFQASEINRPDGRITTARRIFFVVDRRIVVNEAFEQTKETATTLRAALDPEGELDEKMDPVDRDVLISVARWLQYLTGDPYAPPLDCFELRGGIYRDDAWVRSPLQPTVLASTVDQVGSRLMFRGYGVTDNNLSIHAGLTANDSLIILDEAHCSKPFSQTMQSITRYRGAQWAEHEIETPFSFVQMTATPPADTPKEERFELNEADYQKDPLLEKRHACRKTVYLVLAKGAKGSKLKSTLARKMVFRAKELHEKQGAQKIAVVVNRVDLAREVFSLLAKEHGERVELMIGRMRPIDRDKLTKRLLDGFGAKRRSQDDAESTETELEPRFVVATQCLEVGADLDFDGMVSQCASLDALRQRFGRLNRLGNSPQACGAVIAAEGDIHPIEKLSDDKPIDPIYGNALSRTWHWLNAAAEEVKTDLTTEYVIDFGIKALASRTRALGEEIGRLLAPTLNAPVLMPAHIDMLCQTSPRPTPEPDVASYLHGVDPDPTRDRAEVRICWRADLDLDMTTKREKKTERKWLKAIEVCPPSTAECLTVPLNLFRRWLRGAGVTDHTSDVLGESVEPDDPDKLTRKKERSVFVWRGKKKKTDKSERSFRATGKDSARLRPNDTIVIPAEFGGWNTFGHVPDAPSDPADSDEQLIPSTVEKTETEDQEVSPIAQIDVADQAFLQSRAKTIVRVHPKLIPNSEIMELYQELLKAAKDPDFNLRFQNWQQQLRDTVESDGDGSVDAKGDSTVQLPALRNRLLKESGKIVRYPSGLAWITQRHQQMLPGILPLPSFGDDSDSLSLTEKLNLRQHLADVVFELDRLATVLTLPEPLHTTIIESGRTHDLGKADPRFQAMLIDKPVSVAYMQSQLWAKSDGTVKNKSNDLPDGFRHEMLSLELLNRIEIDDSAEGVLLRHLVASHHGRARPYASVCVDTDPPGLNLDSFQINDISAEERKSWIPAHRLDSGIADRFWQMTRYYGWWSLAYLESLLRLSDWQASASPKAGNSENLIFTVSKKPIQAESSNNDSNSVVLSGLDGSNPLAYLAALGAFRTLTTAAPEKSLKMAWKKHEGAWRPVIFMQGTLEEPEFTELLLDSLKNANVVHSKLADLGNDLSIAPEIFRDFALREKELSSCNTRDCADYITAFGNDSYTNNKGAVIQDTAFRTMAGAGHQHFLGFIRNICNATQVEHLSKTLFETWKYDDPVEKMTMRWDPNDDSRYAYQWSNPSGDKSRKTEGSMLGANRLAIEALPLFPTAPVQNRVATTGFKGHLSRNTFWSWPIWERPISLGTIGSVLALAELQDSSPCSETLRFLGIPQVFRVQRLTIGKVRNFSASRSF